MYTNSHRIFLKLLLPFAAGMLGAYLSGKFISPFYIFIPLAIWLTVFLFIRKKYLYLIRYNWVEGICVNAFLGIAGFILFSNAFDLNHKDHFINFKSDDFLVVQVNDPPVFKEKFVRCIVKAEKSLKGKISHDASGNAVVYFANTKEALNFHYGDLILIRNKPSGLTAPDIPYQYDYKGYLDKRNIHFSFFLRENEFVSLNRNDGWFFYRWACNMRDWSVAVIKKYVASPKEAAVVSALTVGYRDEVSQDIVQSYSAAGVIHILAVSGMHVGLLYGMFELILKLFSRIFFLRKISSGILKVIILLTAIWFFAMITGLGGSIVRASAMITAVIIGKNISRRTDLINVLCVSAFVILLLSPFTFIDAGFQLSFTALLGIALWEKNFSQLMEFKNPFVHYIWRGCTVSMAAQLGVLPLTLYYFNQFPLLFLVANIIGVPLSTGILFGGLFLFLLSPFPLLAFWFGWVLKYAVLILDAFINWVQSFSFSTVNIPLFGTLSLVLTTVALFYFAQFFVMKDFRKLNRSLLLMLSVIIIDSIDGIKYLNKKELLFVHFGKGDLYIFRERDNAFMIADDSLLHDNYFSQYTNSFLKHTPVSQIEIIPASSINDSSSHEWNQFKSAGRFISFEGQHGILLDKNFEIFSVNLHLDFVIGKTSTILPEEIKKIFAPEVWIADGDKKNFNFKTLKSACASLSLPLHYLPTDGAWQKQF